MFNRILTTRKRWLALAASTALLALGLAGGTAFGAAHSDHISIGQDGDRDSDARHGSGGGDVMGRVAEILEIEEGTLRAAFVTALDERAEARFEARVQQLLDDETVTADQATEANNWFDERPDGSGPLALKLAGTSDSDDVDDVLKRLVEKDRLTQDEADAMSDWHDDRPSFLPEERGRRHGRGHHSRHGKWDR